MIVMLAMEKYKKEEASLGKASQLAGVSVSKMMNLLEQFEVESNLGYEDYRKGLENLREV